MGMTKWMATLGLALGLAAGAHAGVLFDPDGPGGDPAIDLGQLGWSTTSAVAVGGVTAINNFITSGGSCTSTCTFTVLTMARLVDTTNQASGTNTPAGLNVNYEITMIAAFQETVTAVSGSSATFSTTGTGILQIYFDSSKDSDAITGSGFNDGILILQGLSDQPGQTGIFLVTSATPVILDQFGGTDDYGFGGCSPPVITEQCTVSGTGSQADIPVDTLTQDFAFFITQLATFGINFANISQQLPFRQVDPADCFPVPVPGVVGTPSAGTCVLFHADAPYILNPDGTGYVPLVGPVNGLFTIGFPDFVFQTRYTASVIPQVPEPGSLALLGLGLGALGLGRFRRRSAKLN